MPHAAGHSLASSPCTPSPARPSTTTFSNPSPPPETMAYNSSSSPPRSARIRHSNPDPGRLHPPPPQFPPRQLRSRPRRRLPLLLASPPVLGLPPRRDRLPPLAPTARLRLRQVPRNIRPDRFAHCLLDRRAPPPLLPRPCDLFRRDPSRAPLRAAPTPRQSHHPPPRHAEFQRLHLPFLRPRRRRRHPAKSHHPAAATPA